MPQEQILSLSVTVICDACRQQGLAIMPEDCGNPPFGLNSLCSRFLDAFNQQLSAYELATQIGIGESESAFNARITQELITQGIKGVSLDLGIRKAWLKELVIRKTRRQCAELLSKSSFWQRATRRIDQEKLPELCAMQFQFIGCEEKVQPLMTSKGLVFRLTQLLPELFNYLAQAIDEVRGELREQNNDKRRCIQVILSQLLQLQAQLKKYERYDQAALLHRLQLAKNNKNLNDDDVVYDAMAKLTELGVIKSNPLRFKRSGTNADCYQKAKRLIEAKYPDEVEKLCSSYSSNPTDLFYLTRHYLNNKKYYVVPRNMQAYMPVALPWYKRWFPFWFKGTHLRLNLFNDSRPFVNLNHLMKQLDQQLRQPLVEVKLGQVQLIMSQWQALWSQVQMLKQGCATKLADKCWQATRYKQTQACLKAWAHNLETVEHLLLQQRVKLAVFLLKYLQIQCVNHFLGAKPQLDEDLFQTMQLFFLAMVQQQSFKQQQTEQQKILQSFKSHAELWRVCSVNCFSINEWQNQLINNSKLSDWLTYLKMFPELLKFVGVDFNGQQQNALRKVYQSLITSITQYYLSRLKSSSFAEVEVSYAQVSVLLPFEDPNVKVMRDACDSYLLQRHRQERTQLAKRCLTMFSQRYTIPLSAIITLVMPIYIEILQLPNRNAEENLLCELLLRIYHDAHRICRLQIRDDSRFTLNSCQALLYAISHWRNQEVVTSIKTDKGIFQSANVAYEYFSRSNTDISTTNPTSDIQLNRANA